MAGKGLSISLEKEINPGQWNYYRNYWVNDPNFELRIDEEGTYRVLVDPYDFVKYSRTYSAAFYINSNLGTKPILIERLANKVRKLQDEGKIRAFKLFTSMDTWGERAEYIRTGLDLEAWEKNFHTYVSTSKSPITFMITFNIFSVTSFKSLLEKFLEWRKLYGWDEERKQHIIRFDTPYLRDPIQYDMNILPKEEFMPYMHDALKFMEDNLDDTRADAFSTIEYEKFKRVVDYMAETVYTDEKLIEGRRDFYNWFNELDDRRENDLLTVFPEMMDFYRLCQQVNLTNPL
jgi:hypothetical protein